MTHNPATHCADCGTPICEATRPNGYWELEDGRVVCADCCGKDMIRIVDQAKADVGYVKTTH